MLNGSNLFGLGESSLVIGGLVEYLSNPIVLICFFWIKQSKSLGYVSTSKILSFLFLMI